MKFYYEQQPYGYRTIEVNFVEPVTSRRCDPEYIRRRAKSGWVRVHGTVSEGREVGALLGGVPVVTKDSAGQDITVEVPAKAWQEGRYVFATCG